MNKIIFIIISCFVLITSCSEKQSSSVKAIEIKQKIKNPWFGKFSLPVNTNFETDSTSFVFLKSKSFDTSFLLQLQVEDAVVRGVYYEALPSYHRNLDDYLDTSTNLIAFDGMSFKISFSDWQKITGNSKLIDASDSNDLKNEKPCADCPFYFLSYNNRMTIGVSKNEKQFENYVDFLKSDLIYKLKTYRKPILIPKK
jgi:hypothetical protein